MSSSNGLPPSTTNVHGLKIAVEGCGHGSLDLIYSTLNQKCVAREWSISDLDFLIICGDFQAVRNRLDLNCMCGPQRYLELGDFHAYYSGEKRVPVLTIVIGGNHEVSNYLYELYYGGWLAPNIYYLGAANVIRYGPCRIAGLSGIFKPSTYRKPHGERLPYNRDDIRSIYHVREFDARKLLHTGSQVDIGISHDWPTGVELFGDHEKLFGEHPSWLESAKKDELGSKPAAQILNHLRPAYWFSGHMHTQFAASVNHRGARLEDSLAGLEIAENLQTELPILQPRPRTPPNTKRTLPVPEAVTNPTTEFLALGKPGPTSHFLELKEIKLVSTSPPIKRDEKGKFKLQYDPEWLAITRAFNDGLMIKNHSTGKISSGKPEKVCLSTLPKHKKWVNENVVQKKLLDIPGNFMIHAPIYDPLEEEWLGKQPSEYENSQTEVFCALLGMENKFHLGTGEEGRA